MSPIGMRTLFLAVLMVPAVAGAQTRDQEIRLAKSAAPAEISKDAKVWVLENGHYVVADQGRSTEACVVTRSQSQAFEPQCGDAEADATILAVERYRVEERLAGKSTDQIKRDIDDGFKSGRFHAPKRPALIFMQSSAQILAKPDGTIIGKWMPHLMVFYPQMHDSDLGLVASEDMNIPSVLDPGTSHSAMVIVMHDWVDPSPTQ
jgi:hypothetical protein